jgi:hypothetical protein
LLGVGDIGSSLGSAHHVRSRPEVEKCAKGQN